MKDITTIVLAVVATLSVVALSFRSPEAPKESTAQVIGAMAEILQATRQAPAPPSIINRVNSDDIESSPETKREGDMPCSTCGEIDPKY